MRHSIAIVGRPNTGKSTLFNALVGSRIAIEADTPGVTRDRVLYPLTLGERLVDLIDTGGIGIVDKQDLSDLVENQIDVAINEARVLIFLVDCRDGIMPLDLDIADRLRRIDRPVLLAANKADTLRLEEQLPSFHALGFGDALPVSAKQRRNLDELEEKLLELLPPPAPDEDRPLQERLERLEEFGEDGDEDEERLALERQRSVHGDLLKIAFVGRRNVGKSSLVNCLAGAERVIVSDTPGTTRDSLDVVVERDGEKFVVIDTAGMRRRGQMDDIMEFYGHLRSERAIRRADVVFLMLDCTDEISRVDKRICTLIGEECKPCIITLNKWDLAREKKPDVTLEHFQKYVSKQLPGMHFCPMAAISAKNGENVWNLVAAARRLRAQAEGRAGTGAVNTAIVEAQRKRRPRPQYGKIGKIYYGTQVDVAPPTFLLFCNNPKTFDDNYRRYLENQLRNILGFPEVPLRLVFKLAKDKEVGRFG